MMSMLPDGDVTLSSIDATLSHRAKTTGLLGLTWLSTSVSLLTMFAAFLLFGAKVIQPRDLEGFTYYGSTIYLPEREIPLYVLACAFAVALHAVAWYGWNRRLIGSEAPGRFAMWSGRLYGLIGTVGLIIGAMMLFVVHHFVIHHSVRTGIGAIALAIVPTLEILVFLQSLKQAVPSEVSPVPCQRAEPNAVDSAVDAEPMDAKEEAAEGQTRRHLHWLDILVPVLIVLFLYIPRADLLMGHIFVNEHFHHWDYFMMGPAVGYLRGLALGTQVYSQYGMGWPLVMASLNPVYALSYTHALQLSLLYGIAYYIGLYLFLRNLLRYPLFAAFGTLLALYWRHYAWLGNNFPVWELPQNSILRTPHDVWFLLALLFHLRTQRFRWLAAAALFTGLSLLFETDDGIYIFFIFSLYLFYWLRLTAHRGDTTVRGTREGGRGEQIRRIEVVAAALAIATGVALVGLGIASRGTIGQAAFWRGWLESFIAYPSGVSMLPILAYRQGIFLGMIQIGCYLYTLCYYRLRYFDAQGQRTDSSDSQRLQMWIALYGLCLVIHFIGRSHPNYLFESSLPMAILITVALEKLMRRGGSTGARNHPIVPALTYYGVYGFMAVILLLQIYNMKAYPSILHGLVRQIVKGDRPPSVPLFANSAGGNLPVTEHKQAELYNALAREIGDLARRSKRIAIISNDDSSLYFASGATPWSRYLPLLPNLVTKKQLAETEYNLARGDLDYVYIPAHDPCEMYETWYLLVTTDAWLDLRQIVRQHYRLDHVTGPYEVYRRTMSLQDPTAPAIGARPAGGFRL